MSFLQQVTKGKIKSPHLILIYGTDGVGKSTFASEAPAPIFIGSEDGTKNMDVARFPQPVTLTDLLAQISELTSKKHEYKTLVIDSVDWIEPIIWDYVCKQEGVKSLEKVGGGYGKGYVEAQLIWRNVVQCLQSLQEHTGMNVVMVGHSHVKPFHDPEANVSYDRYMIKMNDKASSILREFVDVVLFANFEVITKEGTNTKTKAYGDGTRVVYTERRPAFDAKNRLGLPFKLPLSWEAFEKAVGTPESATNLRDQIAKRIDELPDDTKQQAQKAFERAGSDAAKLNKIYNKLITIQGG